MTYYWICLTDIKYDLLLDLPDWYKIWLTTGSALTDMKYDLLLYLSDWCEIWFTAGFVWLV
jgi:hypothetical protein